MAVDKDFIVRYGLGVGNTLLYVNTSSNTVSTFGNLVSGNSTVNTVISRASITVANSTANLTISVPPVAAITNGSYYLNANGSYSLVVSVPPGSTTQVAYNNAGAWGSSANLIFNAVNNSLFVGAGVTVGANTFVGTTSVLVGNSTANAAHSATGFNVANSTANITLGIPTVAQITNGNYYLNANSTYSLVISTPAGSNTQVQYNASGSYAASANFTWNGSILSATNLNTGTINANNVYAAGNSTNAWLLQAISSAPTTDIVINNTSTGGHQYLLEAGGTGGAYAGGGFGIYDNTATASRFSISNTGIVTIPGNLNATGGITGNIIGNASGTAYNITQYNINQNLGTSNSPTFSGITVNGTSTFSGTINGYAYPRRADGTNITLNWSGQAGQPTYLWGSNDGINNYVYNPSAFNVNNAVTSQNITNYTINQNLGTGNSPTFTGLTNNSTLNQNGNIIFSGNADQVYWPDGAAVYTDGNGDLGIRTFSGSTYNYTYFSPNGDLSVSGNISTGGAYVKNVYGINDQGGITRVQFNNGGQSRYISTGSGWMHSFVNATGVTTTLIGSGTDTTLYNAGNIVAYWSDQRLKELIERVDSYEGLNRVLSYRVVDFQWNEKGRSFNGKEEGERERGLIAQEVQKINPQAVVNNELQKDEEGNPYLTLNENQLIFDLIGAVQNLQEQVNSLKASLAYYKATGI